MMPPVVFGRVNYYFENMNKLKRPVQIFCTFFFTLVVFVNSVFPELPQRPSGPVADFANVIDTDTELKINILARKLWMDAGFGLLLVTVDSTGNLSPDSFLTLICREWRVWTKEKPMGAVLLLTREPPKVVLQAGEGSKEYLTPEACVSMGKKIDMNSSQASVISEQSLSTVTALAEMVFRKENLPRGELPLFSARQNRPVPSAAEFLQRYRTIIISLGMASVLLIVAVLMRFASRRTKRSFPKEPFGNVLSGDGFGGRLLRKER
ncbi:MAG: TPM domain-containing protein [Chitinispirillaceae bacterium]|nr:TPM domain-containing protein [Chitinispirillaceae bacterium]